MQVFVESVGLLGPGLPSWPASRPILSGLAQYVTGEVMLRAPESLPPAERRRTGAPVKLALGAGLDALARSERSAGSLATVFASSGADGEMIHQICEVLATAERDVSPTRFHNSVHNAPAGYWSIALRSRAPSTSLCCFDWSFAAGLLEACAWSLTEAEPVLLISYDLPYSEPLHAVRPMAGTLGTALLLAPQPTAAGFARLDVRVEGKAGKATQMKDAALEVLRGRNPTGRALPLLSALAGPSTAQLTLDYLDGALSISVSPC
jgi:Beta-ketoacyl synthase, N-terminal domain